MDYTMIYAAIILVIAVGLAFLVRHLRSKNKITTSDLDFIVNTLGLVAEFALQLNPKSNDEIKKISNILQLTTKYVRDSKSIISKDQVIAYTISLCSEFNLQLTQERIFILTQAADAILIKINSEKETVSVVMDKIESIEDLVTETPIINEDTVVETLTEEKLNETVETHITEEEVAEEPTIDEESIEEAPVITEDLTSKSIAEDISDLGSDYISKTVAAPVKPKRKYTKKSTTTK